MIGVQGPERLSQELLTASVMPDQQIATTVHGKSCLGRYFVGKVTLRTERATQMPNMTDEDGYTISLRFLKAESTESVL